MFSMFNILVILIILIILVIFQFCKDEVAELQKGNILILIFILPDETYFIGSKLDLTSLSTNGKPWDISDHWQIGHS